MIAYANSNRQTGSSATERCFRSISKLPSPTTEPSASVTARLPYEQLYFPSLNIPVSNGTGTLWDNSQGYIAWIQDGSVTISKVLEKYTSGNTTLASGTVANIFDGEAHNIKFYAVNATDGKVYGGISIDGGEMITFVDGENPLSITGTNFKMVGVNGTSPRYKIGKYLPHSHEYSKEWSYDESEHWNECACEDKTNVGKHFDADDHKCDVCMKVLSNCTDDDGDYLCDICGNAVGTPPDSSSEADSSVEDNSSTEEDSSLEGNSSLDNTSSLEGETSTDSVSSMEDSIPDSIEQSSNQTSGGCGANINDLSVLLCAAFGVMLLLKGKRKTE